MMDLRRFLSYFDFDYEIVPPEEGYETKCRQLMLEDGKLALEDLDKDLIRLIDKQGAYFGDVDQERYPLNQSSVEKIIDRMDAYIQDCVIDEFEVALRFREIDPSNISFAEMLTKCREENVGEDEVCYAIGDAVANPQSIFIKELLPAEKTKTESTLSSKIKSADACRSQSRHATPIFLFQENRSGARMGKPGDANHVYYADWFEFYSFGSDLNPRSEGGALNFKDPNTRKAVPGGNGVSEVDVIEAFRKANPNRSVVMLSIEPFKGNLEVKMNQALQKFREDGQALLALPPLEAPTNHIEPIR